MCYKSKMFISIIVIIRLPNFNYNNYTLCFNLTIRFPMSEETLSEEQIKSLIKAGHELLDVLATAPLAESITQDVVAQFDAIFKGSQAIVLCY